MRALNQKLLRDLWHLKTQSIAIALVVGTGVAMFSMYLSTFGALHLAQATYYDRYRFADVFAGLERAPQSLVKRIDDIPGFHDRVPGPCST